MLPQYAQRELFESIFFKLYLIMVRIVGDTGAVIAIWLLITVGALLIPIIIIAICCIRRQ
jgi:hypothetical protein